MFRVQPNSELRTPGADVTLILALLLGLSAALVAELCTGGKLSLTIRTLSLFLACTAVTAELRTGVQCRPTLNTDATGRNGFDLCSAFIAELRRCWSCSAALAALHTGRAGCGT